MTVRLYKPTTNARRGASVNLHVEVTKTTPEKSLLRPMNRKCGRNNQGMILGDAANLGFASQPSISPRLTQLDVLVIRVAQLADRRPTFK